MIPILYSKEEKTFTHNGIGFLVDAISCVVDEERNGKYELVLKYPITGRFYDSIVNGAIIKAKANETSQLQLFRIYKISRPFNGIVTYNAEHISYEMVGIPIVGFSVKNANAQTAMTRAFENAVFEHNFKAISDIATLGSTEIKSPCSLRSILGGQDGSILDVWGGEFEFDNFTVKLHQHRGHDNGVRIEYGKNLTDLQQEENISETYTHLLPYAVYTVEDEDEERYIYLQEKVIPLNQDSNIGGYKAYIVDFSDKFGEDEEFTEENLRKYAQRYINTTNIGVPKVSINVSFVQLWQTEEYKNIAPLERVNLCDTVSVYFSKLGVVAKSKVIATTYDSLKEKYEKIKLGEAKSTFADTVKKQNNDIVKINKKISEGQAKATKEWKEAILKATNLITGNSGGHVVLYPAENPQEILILDTDNIETAINVWRWNLNGLGHSSNGYNGEYRTALTFDGWFNTDFIRAGSITGNHIQAGSIDANSISQNYKNEITDEINNKTQIVEQSLLVANELLKSSIQKAEASNEETKRILSEFQHQLDSVHMSFSNQTLGGINLIKNSSGLNGVSGNWEYSNIVTALQNGEAKNNTTSGSMFELNTSDLRYEAAVVIQKKYTLSFKAKTTTKRRCYVLINDGISNKYIFDLQKISEWKDYSITFTASSNIVKIEAKTTGEFLYIADLMLVEGNQKHRWTPAPNEIYTETVKIDGNGINIANSEASTNTQIDHKGFIVKTHEEESLAVNKDLTKLQKTIVYKDLSVGTKSNFIPNDEGFDINILD